MEAARHMHSHWLSVFRAMPAWLVVVAAMAGGGVFVLLALKASPYMAAAALIGLVGMGVLTRYPYLGLLITALIVPIERFGRFTDDSAQVTLSLMRLIGVAALGALLIHNLVQRRGFHVGSSMALYAGFTGLAILGATYSTDFIGTVRACGAILGNLLFFFLVVNLIDSERRVMQCIVLWLAASVAVAVYSTYDWHFGTPPQAVAMSDDFDPGAGVQSTATRFQTVWQDQAEWESLGGLSLRRSMGPTSHAAVYGINLIMTLPFLLLLLRLVRPWQYKLAVGVGLAFILYNTLLTNTRAVVLLTGLVMVFSTVRGLFQFRKAYIVPGLFLFAAALPLLPEDIYNRVLDLSNYSTEKSSSIRIRQEYALAGLRAIGENFLLGMGVGNQKAIPQYLTTNDAAPKVTTTHNIYIQIFMETGVFGWSLFFGFVLQLLYFSFRAAANFRAMEGFEQEYLFMVACQVCMISVLIFGVQVDVFNFPLKGWWLVAGLTYVMYIHSRQQLAEHGPAPAPSPTPWGVPSGRLAALPNSVTRR